MKIGITCYPSAGGSGIIATELGQHLSLRGHEVHFVSHAVPFRLDRYQANLMYHGVEATSYPLFKHPPYTLTLAAKMAEVVREYDLDILHVHYAIPHATCAYLARQLLLAQSRRPVKIITTLHGTDITLVGADPSFYDITRFSIDQSDGVTAVSGYLADETREVFKIEREIRVVHNFFDPDRFKPKSEQCDRIEFANPNEALILHVSNFRPVKRILDVVDIFDRIAAAMPAKLLLVGEGPETVLARCQIKKKGLAEKVIFLGSQSRVEAIMPCADLLLMPSEEESFGLAALESMACGVPVIGSAGTGLAEVVDDMRNGFLLPVGDTTSMAQSAIALLKNGKRLKEFKLNAASYAREHFTSDKIISEYEAYYYEVLNA